MDGARVVVRAYQAPPTPYGAGHRGIDVAASVGVPVVASSTGVVHFAGRVVDRGVLSVRYSQAVIASVEPVTPLVAEGQSVVAGEVIATVDPGHCATPCLHLGVRVNGEYVSPLAFLEGIPRSILLPTRPDG